MGRGDPGTPAKSVQSLLGPGLKGTWALQIVWSFKNVFAFLFKKKKGQRSLRNSLGKDKLIRVLEFDGRENPP